MVRFVNFFFQAEDGIRDYKVTGVQTCALPICFYIGVNGGYGNAAFEDATVTTSDGTISRGGGGQAKGGIVGGQIGVNYQVGAGVFGIEADGQWSGQSYTSSSIFCGATCTLTETAKVTSFATLRGRAGLATDRGLLYATAGGVWTSGSDQFVAAVGSTNTTISNGNGNKVGWTDRKSTR